jgi:hypothetical protein
MIFKRMAMFGMLVAILVGGWIPGLTSAQTPARSGDSPAVFFPEKVFEFGSMIEGANLVHDFVVLNKGKAPLLINNVKTG